MSIREVRNLDDDGFEESLTCLVQYLQRSCYVDVELSGKAIMIDLSSAIHKTLLFVPYYRPD